jgi:dolichol-phosphate mannosyltransferase
MKLVVILPTYNERDNILRLLDMLHDVLKGVKGYDVAYLVVDDNSPDGTEKVVETYQKTHKDVHLITGKKEGLGKALLRGMTYAVEKMGAEVFLQMDADLSHDPRVVPKFLQAIDKGADFAVGSRYIKGGSIPQNWGLHRKIFSVAGNSIVRFGLGVTRIHDWTGGFRAFRKEFYEKIHSEVGPYSGYVFQIAFLHKSIVRGAKITEVPIHFTDRRFGRSKIAPSEYIRNVLWYVASTRISEIWSHSFPKFLVVGTIGFVINTVVLEIMVQFGLHPTLGSVIGAELAILSNFILNNAWTFKDRKIDETKRILKFFQFNGTSLGAVILQAGTIAVGTFVYGVEKYRIFYVIGVLIGLVWNYAMYSLVIWKKK